MSNQYICPQCGFIDDECVTADGDLGSIYEVCLQCNSEVARYEWTKERPTKAGFWILWPRMLGRDKIITYAFYDWGTRLVYFVENRELLWIKPEDLDGCLFARVASPPPLPKEVK